MTRQSPQRPALSIVKVIWGGLLASQLFYIVVAAQSAGAKISDLRWVWVDFNSPFESALAFAAIGVFAAAYIVSHLVQKAAGQFRSVQSCFQAYVIRLALFEACASMGLVISINTQNPSKIIPFMALSIVGFLLNMPDEAKMD